MSNVPENISKVIDEFVKGVNEILGNHVKKIILYGSYARGDYNEKSDVDIMILTNFNFEEIEYYRDEISDIAFELELEHKVIISPVLKNIDKYNARIDIVPFYKNVQREGVVLSNG